MYNARASSLLQSGMRMDGSRERNKFQGLWPTREWIRFHALLLPRSVMISLCILEGPELALEGPPCFQ
jgi:hypothetical protein